MATKQAPGPTPEQLQAYFLAKAETLFDDVSRIADALEVIAQTQLTLAAIACGNARNPEEVGGYAVGHDGVMRWNNTNVRGPVLYGDDDDDDDAEPSPETKPQGDGA